MKARAAFTIALLVIVATAVSFARSPQKIMVWPVIMPPAGEGKVRTCPVCNISIPEAVIEPEGQRVFGEKLASRLKKLKSCQLIFPGETGTEKDKKNDEIAKAIKTASEAGADRLLIPVLLRYRERRGKAYAASETAGVAFNLFLINPAESEVTWRFIYNETQEPLSENLLKIKKFFKRKAKFVKARELLGEGLDEAAKKFPECRESKE